MDEVPKQVMEESIEVNPKKNNSLVKILTAMIIIGLGIVGYLFYQNSQLQESLIRPAILENPIPSPTPDPTIGWKTYANTKYNYLLKYPEDYIAGQNGMNSNSPQTVDFLLVYNAENPDKPKFSVSVWEESDENNLEIRANDHYKKLSSYKLPPNFTLYPGKDNRIVKTMSQGLFLGNKSYSYTTEGNFIEDGASEYTVPIHNHIYMWFESAGNIFLISYPENTALDQILSTFEFTD